MCYNTCRDIVAKADAYIKAYGEQKDVKSRIDTLKSEFMGILKQEKAEKLEIQASNGVLLVTEVPATVMQGFDLERFAEDYPELAAEYAKDTTRAAYLKMTVKK